MAQTVTLMALADMPQERDVHWRGHGLELAVFRVGEDTFAMADSCPHQGAEVTREEILAFFEGKIAKWWTPDDVVFVDSIPLGATGKMMKVKLRDQFANYKMPTA